MATEEDFSFPVIAPETPPRFAESPPLWRTSSLSTGFAQTTKREEEQEQEETGLSDHRRKAGNDLLFSAANYNRQRKSFSYIESTGGKASDTDDAEEKMDMLWEDLNDESSRYRGSMSDSSMSPRRVVEINCIKAFKLSKTGNSTPSGKKPMILVFMRVMKKVFLLHNSHDSIKKRMR